MAAGRNDSDDPSENGWTDTRSEHDARPFAGLYTTVDPSCGGGPCAGTDDHHNNNDHYDSAGINAVGRTSTQPGGEQFIRSVHQPHAYGRYHAR